jgi:hypothetical protein
MFGLLVSVCPRTGQSVPLSASNTQRQPVTGALLHRLKHSDSSKIIDSALATMGVAKRFYFPADSLASAHAQHAMTVLVHDPLALSPITPHS